MTSYPQRICMMTYSTHQENGFISKVDILQQRMLPDTTAPRSLSMNCASPSSCQLRSRQLMWDCVHEWGRSPQDPPLPTFNGGLLSLVSLHFNTFFIVSCRARVKKSKPSYHRCQLSRNARDSHGIVGHVPCPARITALSLIFWRLLLG